MAISYYLTSTSTRRNFDGNLERQFLTESVFKSEESSAGKGGIASGRAQWGGRKVEGGDEYKFCFGFGLIRFGLGGGGGGGWNVKGRIPKQGQGAFWV